MKLPFWLRNKILDPLRVVFPLHTALVRHIASMCVCMLMVMVM